MKIIKIQSPLCFLGGTRSRLFLPLALLSAQEAAGQTPLAYWRFEPGDPGADSSGNGHTLSVTGMTFASDAPANAPDGTNGAVFDGASTFAQTMAPLDLSAYPAFTIEWYMKTTEQDLGMVFELSSNLNANPGSFYIDLNENAVGQMGWVTYKEYL
jgi:hypothetical protein